MTVTDLDKSWRMCWGLILHKSINNILNMYMMILRKLRCDVSYSFSTSTSIFIIILSGHDVNDTSCSFQRIWHRSSHNIALLLSKHALFAQAAHTQNRSLVNKRKIKIKSEEDNARSKTRVQRNQFICESKYRIYICM